MKKLLILLAPLSLTACQVQMDDLAEYIAQTKQSTQVSIEPYPEFTTQPAFEYTASDLRSPFQRPKNTVVEAVQNQPTNCLTPDFARKKHALEAYGVDALAMSGMFTSNGKKWALIIANDGTLHKATLGDHLGLFYGKITSIEKGTISYTEMLPDGAGCWQRKQAQLTMSSQAGENENV